MPKKTKKHIGFKKRYSKKKYLKTSKEYKGGSVLASGGYGCIFKPSLKCVGKERVDGQISKLMTSKHAKSEYNEIIRFKHILQKIPNYSNYFLVDNISLCKPDKLTNEDLENYTEKCKALKKDDITENSINDELDKVLSLNMPFGGIDVSDYIKKYTDYDSFYNLNKSLANLLVKGIVPMNKLHIYHGDIKESNIMVDKSLNTRLIDWGLSTIYKGNSIPKGMYRRPFQYNVPFSVILFNDDFLSSYDEFLSKYSDNNSLPSYFEIREFVVNYIYSWNEIRGPGHIKLINEINTQLASKFLPLLDGETKSNFIEYSFTYYYIIEYLTKIIEKYTHNGKINLSSYFKNIYLKNADIWGFVMVYSSILEEMYNKFNKLSGKELLIYEKIKYLIVHFLFEDPLIPINIPELYKELHNLGQILKANKETSLFTYNSLTSKKKTHSNGKSLLDSVKIENESTNKN
jgi:serine/threonine protein kinase